MWAPFLTKAICKPSKECRGLFAVTAHDSTVRGSPSETRRGGGGGGAVEFRRPFRVNAPWRRRAPILRMGVDLITATAVFNDRPSTLRPPCPPIVNIDYGRTLFCSSAISRFRSASCLSSPRVSSQKFSQGTALTIVLTQALIGNVALS